MRDFITGIIAHEIKTKEREIAAKVESHKTRRAAVAKALAKAKLDHMADVEGLKRDLASLQAMM
jgi:hypothetical protein